MNQLLQKRGTLIFLASGAFGLAWLNGRKPRFEVPQVDLPQARALIDAGALVLDVRNKDAFDHRHVPGALLIPLVALRAAIPASVLSAKERPVVVYCNDGATTGPEAAHILRENGFRHAVNMKTGIEGWAGAGLPMVKAG